MKITAIVTVLLFAMSVHADHSGESTDESHPAPVPEVPFMNCESRWKLGGGIDTAIQRDVSCVFRLSGPRPFHHETLKPQVAEFSARIELKARAECEIARFVAQRNGQNPPPCQIQKTVCKPQSIAASLAARFPLSPVNSCPVLPAPGTRVCCRYRSPFEEGLSNQSRRWEWSTTVEACRENLPRIGQFTIIYGNPSDIQHSRYEIVPNDECERQGRM